MEQGRRQEKKRVLGVFYSFFWLLLIWYWLPDIGQISHSALRINADWCWGGWRGVVWQGTWERLIRSVTREGCIIDLNAFFSDWNETDVLIVTTCLPSMFLHKFFLMYAKLWRSCFKSVWLLYCVVVKAWSVRVQLCMLWGVHVSFSTVHLYLFIFFSSGNGQTCYFCLLGLGLIWLYNLRRTTDNSMCRTLENQSSSPSSTMLLYKINKWAKNPCQINAETQSIAHEYYECAVWEQFAAIPFTLNRTKVQSVRSSNFTNA